MESCEATGRVNEKMIDFKIPCISKLEDLLVNAKGLDIRIRPVEMEKIYESKPGTDRKRDVSKTMNLVGNKITSVVTNANQPRTVRFSEDKNDYHENVTRRSVFKARNRKQTNCTIKPRDSPSTTRQVRQTKIKLPSVHNRESDHPSKSRLHESSTISGNNDSDSDFVDKPGTCHSKQSVKSTNNDTWTSERTSRLSNISIMVKMSISDKKEITRVSRLAVYTPEEVAEQLGIEWKKPEDLCKPFQLVIVKSDEIKNS